MFLSVRALKNMPAMPFYKGVRGVAYYAFAGECADEHVLR